MPTYQYACTECQHDFEAIQSFTDEPLMQCPRCAGRLRKVFNSVGIVFKGSGFYRNDSREKPGERSGGKSDAKSESGDGKNKPTSGGDGGSGGSSGSGGSAGGGGNGESTATKNPGSGSSTAGSAA